LENLNLKRTGDNLKNQERFSKDSGDSFQGVLRESLAKPFSCLWKPSCNVVTLLLPLHLQVTVPTGSSLLFNLETLHYIHSIFRVPIMSPVCPTPYILNDI